MGAHIDDDEGSSNDFYSAMRESIPSVVN